jgi:hypothetical protein
VRSLSPDVSFLKDRIKPSKSVVLHAYLNRVYMLSHNFSQDSSKISGSIKLNVTLRYKNIASFKTYMTLYMSSYFHTRLYN